MTNPNQFGNRESSLMILAMGLGDLPLDEADYLDPTDDEVTYEPAAYLEDELIEEHIENRVAALRVLRLAKARGFEKNRLLVAAFQMRGDGLNVNVLAISLAEELFAVVTPDEITAYLMGIEVQP